MKFPLISWGVPSAWEYFKSWIVYDGETHWNALKWMMTGGPIYANQYLVGTMAIDTYLEPFRGCLLLRGDYLSWGALGHGPSFFRWSRISCCGFCPFESAATANIITSTNSSFFLLGPPWFTASVVNGCLFGSEPLQLPLHVHQSTVTYGWLQRRYLKALPKHWARWGAMKVKSRRKSTTPK